MMTKGELSMATAKEKVNAKIDEARDRVNKLNNAMEANPRRTPADIAQYDKDWDAVIAEEDKLKKLEYELACLYTDDS